MVYSRLWSTVGKLTILFSIKNSINKDRLVSVPIFLLCWADYTSIDLMIIILEIYSLLESFSTSSDGSEGHSSILHAIRLEIDGICQISKKISKDGGEDKSLLESMFDIFIC